MGNAPQTGAGSPPAEPGGGPLELGQVPETLEMRVRREAASHGFDACRFTRADPPETAAQFERWLAAGRLGQMAYLERNAAKRVDPRKVLEGARAVICLAASYAGGQAPLTSGPTGVVARYARFTDYHIVFGERLAALARRVNELGVPGTRSLGYTDTGPFLERDLAQRAGVGFIGKHTNLIGRGLGNWFFLAEIITTAELAPDPPERNRCGHCTRCLAACPTQAIVAPFELDARRCISYLTIELRGPIPLELRPAMGNRIFGCDDCLAVCPWNRFAQEGRLMRGHARPGLAAPDLLALITLDEAAFRARFRNTPIARAQRRGLLRNVCVALGNVGDARALPALARAASDPQPLIAEHARWAIARIEHNRGSAQGHMCQSDPSA